MHVAINLPDKIVSQVTGAQYFSNRYKYSNYMQLPFYECKYLSRIKFWVVVDTR